MRRDEWCERCLRGMGSICLRGEFLDGNQKARDWQREALHTTVNHQILCNDAKLGYALSIAVWLSRDAHVCKYK